MTDAAPAAIRDQPLIAVDVVPVSFWAVPSRSGPVSSGSGPAGPGPAGSGSAGSVSAAPGPAGSRRAGSGGLRVGTAQRRYEPFVGREALPGVLLDGAELLADGARRALRTKTAVDAAAVRHLAQIGAFDGPDRDPRNAAISVAFLAVVAADPDASAPVAGTVWHDVADLPLGLPFDHDRIIAAALDHVRTRLWSDVPLTRALLGERFTTPDAARLMVALTGVTPDPGNLNRALRTNPALTRLAGSAATAASAGSAASAASAASATPASGDAGGAERRGRGGRPPAAWTWSD